MNDDIERLLSSPVNGSKATPGKGCGLVERVEVLYWADGSSRLCRAVSITYLEETYPKENDAHEDAGNENERATYGRGLDSR